MRSPAFLDFREKVFEGVEHLLEPLIAAGKAWQVATSFVTSSMENLVSSEHVNLESRLTSNSEIPHKAFLKFSVFATFTLHDTTQDCPEDRSKRSSVATWFCLRVSSCILKTLKGKSVIFLFLYQINIQFIKVFRVFRDIIDTHTQTKTRLKTFL